MFSLTSSPYGSGEPSFPGTQLFTGTANSQYTPGSDVQMEVSSVLASEVELKHPPSVPEYVETLNMVLERRYTNKVAVLSKAQFENNRNRMFAMRDGEKPPEKLEKPEKPPKLELIVRSRFASHISFKMNMTTVKPMATVEFKFKPIEYFAAPLEADDDDQQV